jgi:hypothetical protein
MFEARKLPFWSRSRNIPEEPNRGDSPDAGHLWDVMAQLDAGIAQSARREAEKAAEHAASRQAWALSEENLEQEAPAEAQATDGTERGEISLTANR